MLKRNAIRHGREFVKHVVPAIIRPARTLWNEVIGFFFLCFAVYFGSGTIRGVVAFLNTTNAKGDGTGDLLRLVMSGFCTLVTLYFGVSSFLRARKIARS